VIAGNPKGVLLEVEKMARSGRDPSQFARDLLAHLRHLLVTQTIGEVPNTFVVTATDEARLEAQAAAIGAATLVRTIDELAAALTAVREGDDARLAVEVALLKAARPDIDPSTEGLLRRVERLEKAVGADGSGAASNPGGAAGRAVLDPPNPTPPPTAAARDQQPDPPVNPRAEPSERDDLSSSTDADSPAGGADSEGSRTEAPPPPADPSEAVSGPAADPQPSPALGLAEVVQVWPAVIDNLRQSAPALAATFDGAGPVALEGDALRIGFPADSTFNKRKAEAPDKRELVAAAVEAVLGARLRPTYVLLDDESAGEGGGEEDVDHEALVEKLKSEFNAEEVG